MDFHSEHGMFIARIWYQSEQGYGTVLFYLHLDSPEFYTMNPLLTTSLAVFVKDRWTKREPYEWHSRAKHVLSFYIKSYLLELVLDERT